MPDTISLDHQKQLVNLAKQSIDHGLERGSSLPIDPLDYDLALQAKRSCFVTIQHQQKLRGCIGSLEASQALVSDVVQHAFAAAFHDPRFPPLTRTEFADLHYSISVLGAQETMAFNSEEQVLDALSPNIDGLILKEGNRRSTFLPSVWKQIPDRREFLQQLKLKAGMPANYWSPTLQIFRYRTFSFDDTIL